MCGFSGILDKTGKTNLESCKLMSDAIIHRGPDDEGLWLDKQAGIALGHRRLSILDLSPEGHQPMISNSGRFVIAYNGEVYNFAELKSQLAKKNVSFRGHSDTEVILAVIEEWGLDKALEQFVGMFAFALWDKKEKNLHLVRDRLGIKPLYYGWVNKAFVFGSELKAIKALPGFNNQVNRDALALMMRHNYIPAPYSIYNNIYKLRPGHQLVIQNEKTRDPVIRSFWSAKSVAETGLSEPFTGNEEEAIDALDGLLRKVVGQRMVSDVPLGAFLSGGYDSTMVVAQMQAQSSRPVKTFSIGFHEQGHNEAHYAKVIASHLKTDHTELYVTPEDAMAVIPLLPTLYDEPFSDSSQIPTYLVSKMARQHVTVSLSGDGGDELFGGYNRYFWGERIWNNIGWVPKGARSVLAKGIQAIPCHNWDKIIKTLDPVIPSKYRFQMPGDKLHKLAEILSVESADALYLDLLSHWKNPTTLVLNSKEPLTGLTDDNQKASLVDFTRHMMFTDLVSYLPDDILTKVDRASMGVSLEARVPLIDHRVVKFAWSLPQHMKVRNGEGKWILRRVLDRYVPREMMDRPKMGFGVPIGSWLRGPLKDWAESLLDERRLKDEQFFNPAPIRKMWTEHLSGSKNNQYYLWDVLMFQSWLESHQA